MGGLGPCLGVPSHAARMCFLYVAGSPPHSRCGWLAREHATGCREWRVSANTRSRSFPTQPKAPRKRGPNPPTLRATPHRVVANIAAAERPRRRSTRVRERNRLQLHQQSEGKTTRETPPTIAGAAKHSQKPRAPGRRRLSRGRLTWSTPSAPSRAA